MPCHGMSEMCMIKLEMIAHDIRLGIQHLYPYHFSRNSQFNSGYQFDRDLGDYTQFCTILVTSFYENVC
jgi:hypothetical protein